MKLTAPSTTHAGPTKRIVEYVVAGNQLRWLAGTSYGNWYDLRDYTTDRHRTTDDTPYGGGAGMVMRPEPLFAAVEALRGRRLAAVAAAKRQMLGGATQVSVPSEPPPPLLVDDGEIDLSEAGAEVEGGEGAAEGSGPEVSAATQARAAAAEEKRRAHEEAESKRLDSEAAALPEAVKALYADAASVEAKAKVLAAFRAAFAAPAAKVVGTPPALQLTLSNAASAKIRGLEFNADGRLGGGFFFIASATATCAGL